MSCPNEYYRSFAPGCIQALLFSAAFRLEVCRDSVVLPPLAMNDTFAPRLMNLRQSLQPVPDPRISQSWTSFFPGTSDEEC